MMRSWQKKIPEMRADRFFNFLNSKVEEIKDRIDDIPMVHNGAASLNFVT